MHPHVGPQQKRSVENKSQTANQKINRRTPVLQDLRAPNNNNMMMNQFLPAGPVQIPPPVSVQTQFIDPGYQAAFYGLTQPQLPMTFSGYSLSPCPSPCPSPSPAPAYNMNMNMNMNINQGLNVSPTLPPIAMTGPQMQVPSIPNQQFVTPSPSAGCQYVDMYGNTLVPVLVGSYSPPSMLMSPPKQLGPQMVPVQTPFIQSSPSNSFTQSVSPDIFRDSENFDNFGTRSRPTSFDNSMPRSRRNSLTSTTENKKELVPRVLRELAMAFNNRFTTTGLRGTDVFRVKCKTKPSLKNILSLLQTLDTHVPLIEVSCPASTKKGKRQKRGFLCYVKVEESLMPLIKQLFDEFNESRGNPFNAIEINPQRKQPIAVAVRH